MVLKRDLMILYEAAAIGVSTGRIIDLQSASSGIYAFSESLEVLFLVGFFYLLRTPCLNLVGRLPGPWASAKMA